jgi:hypothetical protein
MGTMETMHPKNKNSSYMHPKDRDSSYLEKVKLRYD